MATTREPPENSSTLLDTGDLIVDDDVVDRYVDQFDEEADEAHDREADRGRHCDLLKLLLVRLRASLHQTNGVLREFLHWLGEQQNLLHFECGAGSI